jgi:hypothetical protein
MGGAFSRYSGHTICNCTKDSFSLKAVLRFPAVDRLLAQLSVRGLEYALYLCLLGFR